MIKINVYISLIYLLLLSLSSCKANKTVVSQGELSISNNKTYTIKANGTDQTRELQSALNREDINIIKFEFGNYKISEPIVVPTRKILDGNLSTIVYSGNETAIIIGKNELSSSSIIKNFTIKVLNKGVKAIDATWARYLSFSNNIIILRGDDQVGIYMKGNGQGSAPYHNVFKECFIQGDRKNNKNQTAILLEDGGGRYKASGPNRNIFSNFKQISSVDIGVDLKSGDGNIFDGNNFENIDDYHFIINDMPPFEKGSLQANLSKNRLETKSKSYSESRGQMVIIGTDGKKMVEGFYKSKDGYQIRKAPTKSLKNTNYELYKTKATHNIIKNNTAEGTGTSCFLKLAPGASGNIIKDNYVTSVGKKIYSIESDPSSNKIGEDQVLTYSLTGIKKNNQYSLISAGNEGINILFSSFIYGYTISTSKTMKDPKTKIVFKSNGRAIPELNYTFDKANTSKGQVYIGDLSVANPSFLKAGQRLTAELITGSNIKEETDITISIVLKRI